MSLLNKILNWFGLGEPEVQEVPVTTLGSKNYHEKEPCANGCNCNSTPTIVIEPIVESQETPVEVEIKVETPTKPTKQKTTPTKRTKNSSPKSGTKRPAGTRKPRTPRKPKED